MLRIIPLIFLSLIMVASAQVKDITPPDLDPVPPTTEQVKLIRAGVGLHDKGEYDQAIASYQEVLNQNPNEVVTLYEMSMSYYSKNDYRKSLEVALRGTRYKSTQLSRFYMLIATNYDMLGESDKAVEVYQAGIEIMPDLALLHFNLAVTYANLQQFDEARASLKTALHLDPDHPGSHYVLATVFQNGGYKTPALLAILRFLVLEPKSARSATAYQLLQKILNGSVRKGDKPNETHVTVNMSENKDEGDFGPIDMFIGLSGALAMTEENQGKSELELFVNQLKSVVSVISEIDPEGDKSSFVWRYYGAYFSELVKQNYVEPFCYYIAQQSKMEGVQEWLADNSTAVHAFLNWSREYQWPKE